MPAIPGGCVSEKESTVKQENKLDKIYFILKAKIIIKDINYKYVFIDYRSGIIF